MHACQQDTAREWKVDRIVAEARDEDGRQFYKVRWTDDAGVRWSLPEHDWWLLEADCGGCKAAVQEYKRMRK